MIAMTPWTDHIILAAFGTTTGARAAYTTLEKQLAPRFPGCSMHWYYSSPTVRSSIAAEGAEPAASISALIEAIVHQAAGGAAPRIVVQSLHVLPGHEFHRLVRQTSGLNHRVQVGMPLLFSPADYTGVSHCLKPLIAAAQESGQAVLVLGHGTDHPSWTSYCALEAELSRYYGAGVFMATLEKAPGAVDAVIKKIIAGRFTTVRIIPFLMVAGMHFKRDIIGEKPESMKNLFEKHDIALHLHEQGLTTLPGIADIFAGHIRDAFAALTPPC
jgi:sirohydrochlorin cobaltochelatase